MRGPFNTQHPTLSVEAVQGRFFDGSNFSAGRAFDSVGYEEKIYQTQQPTSSQRHLLRCCCSFPYLYLAGGFAKALRQRIGGPAASRATGLRMSRARGRASALSSGMARGNAVNWSSQRQILHLGPAVRNAATAGFVAHGSGRPGSGERDFQRAAHGDRCQL